MAKPPKPTKPPKQSAKPSDPGEGDDTESAAELQRQIADLQAKLARQQAAVQTDGGAVVQGSVRLSNGHFIGRDSISIVNQVMGPDSKAAQLALSSYLHALATDLAGLRLGEIDASVDQTKQTPLQLPDIYVPLNTTFSKQAKQPLERALAALNEGKEPSLMSRANLVQARASALEALAACKQLTLLGAPGSGKSTFGAHVLLTLAQAWQQQHKQVSALEGLGKAWKHGALLPVRVVLRRFAESHATSTQKLSAGDLWNFIGQDLHEGGWGAPDEAMKFVQRLTREHGALVLLDGLDECGDATRRERVMGAVNAFMKSEGQRSLFLLTARPYAFPKGADPKAGIFELAEFDESQIKRFVTRWYEALAQRGWRSASVAASKRDELIAATPRPDLQPLASNPLLLTLMATLHSNRGRLPDDRVQLYEDTVDLLLQRWNKDVGADRALLDALAMPTLTLANLRSVLEAVAFQVHEANVGEAGLAEVGEDQLARAFRPLLGGSKDKADQVVEFIERRAGLLIGQGAPHTAPGQPASERRFTFPHRTFQEFLAACHLCKREQFAKECRRLVDHNAAHWRVVLPLAARLADAERGATAADELIGGVDVQAARRKGPLTPAHWQRALTAGMQLQEIGVNQLAPSERCNAVLARVQAWLVAGLPLHPQQGGAPAPLRAETGDVLAALGDPRFDPQRLHLPAEDNLGFVHISADPGFVVGTQPADKARVEKAIGHGVGEEEINDEPVAVGEFWIARYPVTVAQFQAFVDATGQAPGDLDALRGPATRPVRFVSWNEALAYCQWLQQQLQTSPALQQSPAAKLVRSKNWQVSLPSELEWELAARGGQRGKVFSWGDAQDPERANHDDSGVGDASAVGCFAPNSFGLHDLLGNVWEWTRSKYEPYPHPPNDEQRESLEDEKGSRVVRGGAFNNSSDVARCGFRFYFRPGHRVFNLGFRVVLRSSPVELL